MSVYNKDNKFISYLIILISAFILVFITRNQFFSTQENLNAKQNYEQQKDDKKSKLQEINALRTKLKQDSSSLNQDIKKLSTAFKEDELINYIYSYVEDANSENASIVIKNVSITKPVQNELWFNEVDLNIGLRISSESVMISFLNFLLSENSKYYFLINKFDYLDNEEKWSFNVSIPVKIFYK